MRPGPIPLLTAPGTHRRWLWSGRTERIHAAAMIQWRWTRFLLATLYGIPAGVAIFAYDVDADSDPVRNGSQLLSGIVLLLTVVGPPLVGWFWRSSGVAGVTLGGVLGMLGGVQAYHAVTAGWPVTALATRWADWAPFVFLVYALPSGLAGWVARVIVRAVRQRLTASPRGPSRQTPGPSR